MNDGRKRLLASDFDGTLCIKGVISDRNREAIRRWQQEGNLFGIVTGRDPHGARNAVQAHPEVSLDFVICCSGALVCDSKGRVINETVTDLSRVSELARYIADGDPLWLSRCLGDRMLGVPLGRNAYRAEGEIDESGRRFASLSDFCADIDGSHGFHMLNTAYESREEAARHTEFINREFAGYVTAHRNSKCLDITRADTGKTEGVLALAAHLGIDRDLITAAGDSYNDLGMLNAFGGFAVEGAEDAVKSAAPAVCADIADIIERFI